MSPGRRPRRNGSRAPNEEQYPGEKKDAAQEDERFGGFAERIGHAWAHSRAIVQRILYAGSEPQESGAGMRAGPASTRTASDDFAAREEIGDLEGGGGCGV